MKLLLLLSFRWRCLTSGKENCNSVDCTCRCSEGRHNMSTCIILLCSFEIEHRADSSKAADMHEARAGKMSDVIEEGKVWSKITPKLRTEEFGCESMQKQG